jgi:hypothetical protein
MTSNVHMIILKSFNLCPIDKNHLDLRLCHTKRWIYLPCRSNRQETDDQPRANDDSLSLHSHSIGPIYLVYFTNFHLHLNELFGQI